MLQQWARQQCDFGRHCCEKSLSRRADDVPDDSCMRVILSKQVHYTERGLV